jgi:hypothetical protein
VTCKDDTHRRREGAGMKGGATSCPLARRCPGGAPGIARSPDLLRSSAKFLSSNMERYFSNFGKLIGALLIPGIHESLL